MTTNNFLDTCLKAQNKALDQWLKTSKQLQKAVFLNNPVTNENIDLYYKWLDQQTDILERLRKDARELTRNFPFTSPEDWYDRYMKNLKEDLDMLSEMNREISENLANSKVDDPEKLADLQEKQREWLDSYRKWLNRFSERFNERMNPYPIMANGEKEEMMNTLDALKERLDSLETKVTNKNSGGGNSKGTSTQKGKSSAKTTKTSSN